MPADGGPALKQTADIRLGQTVTRVELVDHGVAVHVEGQVLSTSQCAYMCHDPTWLHQEQVQIASTMAGSWSAWKCVQ